MLAKEIKGWRKGDTYGDDLPRLRFGWEGYQWALHTPTAERECSVPAEIAWTDEEGSHHSMSVATATDLLAELFGEWPGGLEEIEASLNGWRRRAQQLEAQLAASPSIQEGRTAGTSVSLNSAQVESSASEWRPIETAPKDGNTILIARHMDSFGWIRGYARWDGDWISCGFDAVLSNLGLAHPTHWMPLPSPPSKEQSK